MKIIHLSDLHIHKTGKNKDNFSTILTHLSNSNDISKDCVIIITGDLLFSAIHDKKENQGMLQWIMDEINKLKEKVGEIFIVPGNHDYGNYLTINPVHMQYFKTIVYGNPDMKFPIISKPIGGYIFIGLDSNEGNINKLVDNTSNFMVGTNGLIGDIQFKQLDVELEKEIFNSNKIVLYLHHDPFYKKPGYKLLDYEALKNKFENKISLLLCGHSHNYTEWHNWGFPTYNAGKSIESNDTQLKIRCIEMNDDKIDVSEITLTGK